MLAQQGAIASSGGGLEIDNVLYLHDKANNRLKAYDIQTDTYLYDVSVTGYNFNGAIDKEGNAYIYQSTASGKVSKVDLKGVITNYPVTLFPRGVFVDDYYFYVFDAYNVYFAKYAKSDGSKVAQISLTGTDNGLRTGVMSRDKTKLYFTSAGTNYYCESINLATMKQVTVSASPQELTFSPTGGTAMLPNGNIVEGSSYNTKVFSPTTVTTIYTSESAADCYSDTIHVFLKLDASNPRIRRFNPDTLAQIDIVTIPNATTAGGYLGMVELKDYIATMVHTTTTYINICKKSDFTSVKSITLGGYSYMYRYR